MNHNSYLAIENLRVLNSDIDSEICKGPDFKNKTTTTTTISVTSTSEKVTITIPNVTTERTSAIEAIDNIKNNVTEVKLNFTTALTDNEKVSKSTKAGILESNFKQTKFRVIYCNFQDSLVSKKNKYAVQHQYWLAVITKIQQKFPKTLQC
jgi:hypothetical protein